MGIAQLLQSKKNQDRIGTTTKVILLIIFSVTFILPLFWLVSTALKTPEQVYAYPLIWIPHPVRLLNFPEAWSVAPFGHFLVNSLITTLIPMAGEVFISSLVAYSFARLRWPGRDKVFALCLATMMMPWVVTFIPVFIEFSQLGWVNTFLPLIVPALFGNAFYIFLIRQFMLTLPKEMEEAARMDGANTLQIFTQVVLPLITPALTTVAIFSFMSHWNDYLGPMIYLHAPELKTLILGLATFESMMMGTGGSYGFLSSRLHLLMAMTLLIDIPCILIFLIFQKYFVEGAILSGLKV